MAPSLTPALPPEVVAYRRTPIFTEATLPAGLRRRHRTKTGTWGLIVVTKGQLRLRRLDPRSDTMLDPASPAVVAPGEPHEVEPIGPVQFYVEFYSAAGTA